PDRRHDIKPVDHAPDDRRHARAPRSHQAVSVPTGHDRGEHVTRAAGPRVLRQSRERRMSDLTHVELTWLKQRIENWIRFGHIAEEHVIDRQHRVVSFAADSTFAFVRWSSNDYGTIMSRVDILRAVQPGERYSTVPFVRPGGESLLRIAGWPKVEKVLQAIDGVETLGIDPADAAPEHWRHIHNR